MRHIREIRSRWDRVGLAAGLAMGLIVATGTPVAAQPAGELRWEVSSDNGSTWNTGRTIVPNAGSVLVRAVASWTGVPDALGLAGTMFDVVV